MKTELEVALSALRETRVLIVGDSVLDTYIYGETVRVSREAPVIVVRRERTEHRLGGAANTAANLAALGCKTTLVTLVGDDDGGKQITRLLAKRGVEVVPVSPPGLATTTKTRVLAGAFGTTRQQVLRLDDEPSAAPTAAAATEMVEKMKEATSPSATQDLPQAVLISDYGYGAASEEIADHGRKLHVAGTPVFVDSRGRLGAFSGVAAVTPNTPEAEEFCGFQIDNETSVRRAGRLILRQLGCDACLLTQGRGGMTLFRAAGDNDPTELHVDIVGDDEVADVSGAGDTVIATFCAAAAAGLGMEKGMQLANLTAGVVVAKAGTATASHEEIIALANREGWRLQ